MARTVKNLPTVWETLVQSLGWEDLQEKGMASHSRILAWEIPWTEEPGQATVHGVTKELETTKHIIDPHFTRPLYHSQSPA